LVQIRSCHSAARRVVVLAAFRSPDVPITRSPDLFSAAFCLCPSALDPTPLDDLLKTKAKVQFDRPVTDRLISIFVVFASAIRVIREVFSPL
jgi:hypothetical protein